MGAGAATSQNLNSRNIEIESPKNHLSPHGEAVSPRANQGQQQSSDVEVHGSEQPPGGVPDTELFVAVFDFDPHEPPGWPFPEHTPLPLRKGEEIRSLLEEGDWTFGEIVENPSRQGWFPQTFTIAKSRKLSMKTTELSQAALGTEEQPVLSLGEDYVAALHEFDPSLLDWPTQHYRPLALAPGQLLQVVIDDEGSEWSFGCPVGQPSSLGFIAKEYTTKVSMEVPLTRGTHAVAMQDFKTSSFEGIHPCRKLLMPLNKGDLVEVAKDADADDLVFGRILGQRGRIGFFPKGHIVAIVTDRDPSIPEAAVDIEDFAEEGFAAMLRRKKPSAPAPPRHHCVIAKRDLDPSDFVGSFAKQRCLRFKQGQQIRILLDGRDDWAWGHAVETPQVQGFFPLSFTDAGAGGETFSIGRRPPHAWESHQSSVQETVPCAESHDHAANSLWAERRGRRARGSQEDCKRRRQEADEASRMMRRLVGKPKLSSPSSKSGSAYPSPKSGSADPSPKIGSAYPSSKSDASDFEAAFKCPDVPSVFAQVLEPDHAKKTSTTDGMSARLHAGFAPVDHGVDPSCRAAHNVHLPKIDSRTEQRPSSAKKVSSPLNSGLAAQSAFRKHLAELAVCTDRIESDDGQKSSPTSPTSGASSRQYASACRIDTGQLSPPVSKKQLAQPKLHTQKSDTDLVLKLPVAHNSFLCRPATPNGIKASKKSLATCHMSVPSDGNHILKFPFKSPIPTLRSTELPVRLGFDESAGRWAWGHNGLEEAR